MIEGYLGRLGAGKTYNMVRDSLPYIGKLPIWTNMEDGRILEWANHFSNWDDLLGLTNALVLIDELGIWAASREYTSFPKEVLRHIINSRKQGLHIKWTAQHEGGVDISFRRQTAVYYRHVRYANFVHVQVEDATSGEKMYTRWVILEKKVYSRYDTYEIVGDATGQGAGRGAAGKDREAREAEEILKTALIRDTDPITGAVVYRRAVPADLHHGRAVVRRGPGGLLVPVDPKPFQLANVMGPVAGDAGLGGGTALAARGTSEAPRAPGRPFYGRKKPQEA